MVLCQTGINESTWKAINTLSFSMLKLVNLPETFSPSCAYRENFVDSASFGSCSFIQNLPELFGIMNFSLFFYMILFYIKQIIVKIKVVKKVVLLYLGLMMQLSFLPIMFACFHNIFSFEEGISEDSGSFEALSYQLSFVWLSLSFIYIIGSLNYVYKVFKNHPFQEIREEKLLFLGFETKNFLVSAIVYNVYWFIERILMVVVVLKMIDKPLV
jgi:hypothetical protein